MSVRRFINRLHLWLALITALPLFVLCVTGALLVFEEELLRWENRQLTRVKPAGEAGSLQACFEAAKKARPDLKFASLRVPRQPGDAVLLISTPPKPGAWNDRVIVSINPFTAEMIGARRYFDGFMPKVRALHASFLAGEVGRWLAGLSTIAFLLILTSGLVLWFKRGGGWRKLLIKWDARGKRLQYDLHASFGLYSSVALVLIALSGVLIWIGTPWRNGILKLTNSQWRDRPALPPEQLPVNNAPMVSIDAALALARRASPETTATAVLLPQKPQDPVSISMRFWWGSRPTLTVSVHPVTGELFDIDDPRKYESGHLIHRLNRGLHSGETGTEVMRWLWFGVSFVPLLLIYTGWRLWRKPVAVKRQEFFVRREVPLNAATETLELTIGRTKS